VEQDYSVYNSTLPAIVRGLKERVFFVKTETGFAAPFKPKAGSFRMALQEEFTFLRKHLPTVYPMTRDSFVDCYRGRQRTVYAKAVAELDLLGWNDRYSNLKTFMKKEKYNFTKKKDPVPRIIQPRDAKACVETGRYIRPIEGKIYRVLDTLFGKRTVCKGLNASQRGKLVAEHWRSFSDPVAVGIDASRFDQHVSPAALAWEHSVYKLAYPKDSFFSHLLYLQMRNKGAAYTPEGKVKYKVTGNRMSGDPNTALGNVLIMCSMVHAYFRTLNFRCSFVNDGDDGVIFLERKNLETLQQNLGAFFTPLGFDMTVEDPAFSLEEIEFCQCHPVFDGTDYLMVRDPRVSISKDSVAIKPLTNEKLAKRWSAAVAEGGLSLTGGLPVWQEFYAALKRYSGGLKPLSDPTLQGTGLMRLGRGMGRTPSTPSPAARFSFWLAFGIPPDAQQALEAEFRDYSPTILREDVRFVPNVLMVGLPSAHV
jgi:hypothetical protein